MTADAACANFAPRVVLEDGKMRRRLLAWIIIVLAITTSGPAFAQTASSSLTAAVQRAVNRGELLYIYDEAAWHGTDDIRANFPSLLSQAGGYVVTGDEATTELVFYDRSKSNAVYRATLKDGKIIKSGGPARDQVALTALERQMIVAKDRALAAVIAAKVSFCSEAAPNLTALPPERPGAPIIVYLMTPRTVMQNVPLGGHFSVEVAADGKVSAIRHFTNSCIDMPLGSRPAGAGASFVITHLLDPTPTEIHVFSSLTAKVPLIVLTSRAGRMWLVDGNRVTTMPAPAK